MLPQLGWMELVLVIVIILLIFGASRLKDIGTGLGGAINAFRKEVKNKEEDSEEQEKKAD